MQTMGIKQPQTKSRLSLYRGKVSKGMKATTGKSDKPVTVKDATRSMIELLAKRLAMFPKDRERRVTDWEDITRGRWCFDVGRKTLDIETDRKTQRKKPYFRKITLAEVEKGLN